MHFSQSETKLTKHIYELKHNTRYICGKHTKKVKKEKNISTYRRTETFKNGKTSTFADCNDYNVHFR